MRQGLLNVFLFSLLWMCTVGVFVPIDLYVNNQGSANSDLHGILFAALPYIMIFPLISTLFYKMISTERVQLAFALSIGVVSISAWANATFLFGSYGQIDGRGLSIDPVSLLSFVQILFIVVIAYVLFKYRFSNAPKNIALSLLFIGLFSTLIGIYVHINDGGKFKLDEQRGFNNDLLAFSKERNVVHVILDELQSDVFENILKKNNNISEIFEGFVFFPDAISSYPTTVMSLPSMFTGEVYKNTAGRREFVRSLIDEGKTLPAILGKEDYIASMHGGCDGIFSSCSPNLEATLNKDDFYSLGYLQLLDLSIFRISPDFLKRAIYSDEKWFVQRYLFSDEYMKTSYVGLAHKIFEKFNQSIFLAKNNIPTYKVYHSVITHSPIWLDEKCQPLDTPAAHTLEGKSNEALCALSHVNKFFIKLKDMGIYENTMIVVSSDHGSNYYPESVKADFQKLGIPYSTAASTLLIKPFNSTGPMKSDDYPATLLDIPSTILGEVNVNGGGGAGINLFSSERPNDRKRQYLYYSWNASYEKKNKLPPISTYAVDKNIKNPASWTLIDAEFNDLYFPASELPTQIGVKDGDALVTGSMEGKKGFLNYGPYVDLNKGIYNISITYESSMSQNDVIGWVDVMSSGGKIVHHKESLYGTIGEEKLDIQIELNDYTSGFEVRTHYDGVGKLAIKSLKIEKTPE